MNTILVGNIVAFIGCMIMVSTGFIKKRKDVILVQCIQFTIQGLGYLILGGITGVISNVISLLRNLVVIKKGMDVWLKLFFIALQVIPAIIMNKQGLIGFLPIIACCIFTWFIDTKDDMHIKYLMIGTEILWLIFDIYLFNFSGAAFDVTTIITNIIGAYRIIRERKLEAESSAE